MTDFQWYAIAFIAVVALGSGAIGAFIYAVVTTLAHRKPRIGCRVDTFPSFANILAESGLRSRVSITNQETESHYEELQIVEVQVSNESTHDFAEFELGLTLSSEDIAVHIGTEPPDRNHVVKLLKAPSFDQPQSEIDLLLRPFNRDEVYKFHLLVVTPTVEQLPGTIVFSSPEAIHFIDKPTVQEAVKKAAKSTSISLGPFQISFD